MCGIPRLDFVVIPWIRTRLVSSVNAFKKHLRANYLPHANLDVGELRSNKETFLSLTSPCGCMWRWGVVWVESCLCGWRMAVMIFIFSVWILLGMGVENQKIKKGNSYAY